MRIVIFCLVLIFCAPSVVAAQWSQRAFPTEATTPASSRMEWSDSTYLNAEASLKLERRLTNVAKGALIGAGVGAVAFGGMELFDDHVNHEDDFIVAGVLMLIGATAGAIVGIFVR